MIYDLLNSPTDGQGYKNINGGYSRGPVSQNTATAMPPQYGNASGNCCGQPIATQFSGGNFATDDTYLTEQAKLTRIMQRQG